MRLQAYFPPFQHLSAIASMFTSVVRMERYESRFRNSLLPDTVRLKDGFEDIGGIYREFVCHSEDCPEQHFPDFLGNGKLHGSADGTVEQFSNRLI